LKEGFKPEFSFVAVSGGEMVGIAGFKTEQGSLTGGMSLTRIPLLGACMNVLALCQSRPTDSPFKVATWL